MTAYYNEHDPYAAQWLRNLISAGHIAPGEVDERSIEDVLPSELRGFTQCHWFAGVGGWSLALRRAGWPDNRAVWTGSCPCQPFSAAGKGAGFVDERHLWPSLNHLIGQLRPQVFLGEQVASKDGLAWLDLVLSDLEGAGYAAGAVDLCAAGVGAPHIRQRLWIVGHSLDAGLEGHSGYGEHRGQPGRVGAEPSGPATEASGSGGLADATHELHDGSGRGGSAGGNEYPNVRSAGGMADVNGRDASAERQQRQQPQDGGAMHDGRPSPTNGLWGAADWIFCRDGKWRPVEPGYEQMADGSAASLGRVRPSTFKKIEDEVNAWSIRYQADPSEALRRVWRDLSAEALSEREAGRFSGVYAPSVLLAFLRQLANEGWRFALSVPCAGPQAPPGILRVMQFDPTAARTSLRRELGEQRSDEPTDPLRELSSILAYHAEVCWGEACRKKAGAASFPLASGAPSRVGRLRAFGNCINIEAATVFIGAVM